MKRQDAMQALNLTSDDDFIYLLMGVNFDVDATEIPDEIVTTLQQQIGAYKTVTTAPLALPGLPDIEQTKGELTAANAAQLKRAFSSLDEDVFAAMQLVYEQSASIQAQLNFDTYQAVFVATLEQQREQLLRDLASKELQNLSKLIQSHDVNESLKRLGLPTTDQQVASVDSLKNDLEGKLQMLQNSLKQKVV